MATYEESGVNISLGDKCSKIAYEAAMKTFSSRKGMMAAPLIDEGGFSGLLDMGDFYLVQNDDGVGTKIKIAEMTGQFDTLGYDLIAMVADDAVCLGAETISVTNTLDVDRLDEAKVASLMSGLEKAAKEQQIVIPGGEIAELGDSVNGYIWNATAVGIVEKKKLITGADIQKGDLIIGLCSAGLRSNGFSLVRHILSKKFGPEWHGEPFDGNRTWGEVTLTPSRIYSGVLLKMHGRYKEPPKVEIKGIAHITGGGIHANLARVLKKSGLKARLDKLPEPHAVMTKLMELGDVSKKEAYSTWNMGVGMILISKESERIIEIAHKNNIEARIIGEVV